MAKYNLTALNDPKIEAIWRAIQTLPPKITSMFMSKGFQLFIQT